MKFPKLIGVIHLPPLPGSPGAHAQSPSEVLQTAGFQAVKEAQILSDAGFDGIILENFGDVPFYKTQVAPETIASMAIIAAAVREMSQCALGINVLRNDARSALAIAAVTGCDFIRVNVLSGVAATDQGMIEGDAAFLLRERDRLGADVAIFADVHVKHAVTFSSYQMDVAIEEVGCRANVDAVIVSGRTTGRLIESEILKVASRTARHLKMPLLLGSGANVENLSEIRPWVDGVIVGSALRQNQTPGAPLEVKQVREFVKKFNQVQKIRKSGIKTKKKKS